MDLYLPKKNIVDLQIRLRAYSLHQLLTNITASHSSCMFKAFDSARTKVAEKGKTAVMEQNARDAYGLMYTAYRRSLKYKELKKLKEIEVCVNDVLDVEASISPIQSDFEYLDVDAIDEFEPIEFSTFSRNHFLQMKRLRS